MDIQIRKVIGSDEQDITNVVVSAFGDEEGQEIADLITALLADPSAQPLLSLVATAHENIVGHVLFSNVCIKNAQRVVSATILAPLSVHPEYQKQGIGGRLIEEGLNRLKAAGVELVFVLGHPDYYAKYGFSSAGIKAFDAPYPIPPQNSEAWMVQELRPGIIGHVRGQVVCADTLNEEKYWQE